MAIDLTATPQATTEVRTHYVDFTKDLPSGVTVSACTAGTGTFPTGGTAGISVGAISANVAPGLRFRPLEDTIRDTIAWAETRPADHEWRAGLNPDKENILLAMLKRNDQ